MVLVIAWLTAAAVEAGTLKVTSFPSGAQVFVDDVNTGKVTPMNVSLSEGEHKVTVMIPSSGWNTDTRIVTIVAGNNDLSVTLLPLLTSGPQGPQGPPGPAGAAGAPGAPGPLAFPPTAMLPSGLPIPVTGPHVRRESFHGVISGLATGSYRAGLAGLVYPEAGSEAVLSVHRIRLTILVINQ